MTIEQYEKGAQIYRYIESLKNFIEVLEYERPIRIQAPEIGTHQFFADPRIRNNITSYIHINEAAIKAELLDFAKNELALLEDQLKEI